jgi:hypothetical protein
VKLFRKIKKISFSYWREIIVVIMAMLFFMACSSFLVMTQDFSADLKKEPDFVKWTSPDETANYIFAKLYAQEGRIYLNEDYNKLVDDIMRPRSVRSDNGVMKPISFLGIILIYGKIASLFSYKVIPFLTPLFASLGLIFYYFLIKRIFGRNNALISTLLLAFFPPFFYYSVRSMFHNVLFTVMLVIGANFAYLMVKEGRPWSRFKESKSWKFWKAYFYSALAGIFFGFAIMARTSELLWLAPVFLFLWLTNIRQLGFFRLMIFIVFLGIAVSPMLYFNKQLYGAMFSGGYPEMNASIHTITTASTDLVGAGLSSSMEKVLLSLKSIKETIFHFGYDWEQSKDIFDKYFVQMFSWIFWPALGGLFLFFTRLRRSQAKQWYFLIAYLIASFILVVYYGSWDFHDNPDAEAVTIGNSYTRYWLPVYLGAIPFASLLLMRLTRWVTNILKGKFKDDEDDTEEATGETQLSLFLHLYQDHFGRHLLRFLAVGLFAYASIGFVLYGSEEGLSYTIGKVASAKAEWREVLALTENNSAIVTLYHDKVFFPERKVVVGIFDDKNMNDRYTILAEKLPLYYYNFRYSQDDIDYLNKRRLAPSQLHIEPVKEINDTFALYRLTSTREEEVSDLKTKK